MQDFDIKDCWTVVLHRYDYSFGTASTLLLSLSKNIMRKNIITTILADKVVFVLWDDLIAKERRSSLCKKNNTPSLSIRSSSLLLALQLFSAVFCQRWDKKNEVYLSRGFHFGVRSLEVVWVSASKNASSALSKL